MDSPSFTLLAVKTKLKKEVAQRVKKQETERKEERSKQIERRNRCTIEKKERKKK
jgi:hypothetical protein